MKKVIISAALLLGVFLSVSSCKKKDNNSTPSTPTYTCTACVTTPEAAAANDGSSKGIYKGIIIGSSGTVKFSVQNGSNDITATLVVDGTTVTLTSTVSWVSGQPYIAPFTGTMNGQAVSITFSVNADGSTPIITASDIPGHPNAVFSLAKETSDALIECFEGTYSTTKPESGTFNIVLSRKLGKWGGIARKTGSTDKSDIHGLFDNGTIKDDKGKTVATLTGDNISGSFTDDNGSSVTITGKRTE